MTGANIQLSFWRAFFLEKRTPSLDKRTSKQKAPIYTLAGEQPQFSRPCAVHQFCTIKIAVTMAAISLFLATIVLTTTTLATPIVDVSLKN